MIKTLFGLFVSLTRFARKKKTALKGRCLFLLPEISQRLTVILQTKELLSLFLNQETAELP